MIFEKKMVIIILCIIERTKLWHEQGRKDELWAREKSASFALNGEKTLCIKN